MGLVLAMIFAASMSSTVLRSSTPSPRPRWSTSTGASPSGGSDRHGRGVASSRPCGWGGLAIAFAEYANRLGSLVEAVNILGSLFYGTILGIFLSAFYVKRVRRNGRVLRGAGRRGRGLACFHYTRISFLWYNLIGCLAVVGLAWGFSWFGGPDAAQESA